MTCLAMVYTEELTLCVSQGTKFWLTGFQFEDASVLAQNITNVEFAEILTPTSDKYRDYFNFVYDVDDYDFCDGSDSWFN
jgi:hypothetical protein